MLYFWIYFWIYLLFLIISVWLSELIVFIYIIMASPGQRKGACRHIMPNFDKHSRCARCRDKGQGDNPCLKQLQCDFCDLLTPEQVVQLATPTYKLRNRRIKTFSWTLLLSLSFRRLNRKLQIVHLHITLLLISLCQLPHSKKGARWCSGYSSCLQPLRPPVRISGRALHVGKLVVTCRCPVVYSAVCTAFLHL